MHTISSGRRLAPDSSTRVDLTPMLDVVFILLIFFVVAAIQFEQSAMDLAYQESAEDQPLMPDEAESILIKINADDGLTFNDAPVTLTALKARITQVLATHPQAPFMINPHRQSAAQTLVSVADIASAAGIRDVNIMPKTDR